MNNIDFNIKLLEKNDYDVSLTKDDLEIKKNSIKYKVIINPKYFIYNDVKYSYNNRIIDIIENIYVVDESKETNIYYISNRKIKFSKKKIDNNNFYLINFNEFLKYKIEDIKKIFDYKYNVYIFIESENNIKLTEHFNDLLEEFFENNKNRLLNITIVNYTEDTRSIIYNFKIDDQNIFKKIINIFPYNKKILIDKKFVSEYDKYYYLRYRSSYVIVNYNNKINDKDMQYLTFYPYTYNFYEFNYLEGGKNNTKFSKEFVFNFINFVNVNEDKKKEKPPLYLGDIKEIWWYKYYFEKSICSYGRLLQSSGTCWCNTLLNILFLTDSFRKILINSYYSKKRKDIKLKDFVGSKYGLEDLFFALVNNILIKKQKAYVHYGDIVLQLAARIKGIHMYNDEFYYKKDNNGINFGEAYSAYYGFYVLLPLFLDDDKYYNLYTFYNLRDSKNKIYDNNDNINLSNLKDLEQLKSLDKMRLYTKEESDKFLKSKIEIPFNIKLSHLSNLSRLSNKIPELKNLSYLENLKYIENNIIYNEQKDLAYKIAYQICNRFNNIKIYTDKKLPIYLLVDLYGTSTNLSISKEIYINDIKYKLVASSISISYINSHILHAISGIICDDKPYIYDSQNKITDDDWTNGKIDKYKNFIELERKYTNNNIYDINTISYDCVIYINSDVITS